MSDAIWVSSPSAVWELRPRQRAICHDSAGANRDHDFSVDEIKCYADHGDWQYVSEEKARELIAALQAPNAQPQCATLIEKRMPDGRYRIVQCSRKAKVGDNCTQHHRYWKRVELINKMQTRAHTY
jgi:hypothetical protein